MSKYFKYVRLEYFLISLFFIFSWALMWKTFRLGDGTIEMATRVWSDFGATLPLTRSFSYGNNFPPQYPLFSGAPIRYHFVFYMLVGLGERIGIPLDWALNGLSIIGFFLLLCLIYFLSKNLFKSSWVGVISVILFLFNSSLGFLEFFKKNPLSLETPLHIIRNTEWSSFGPYDGKIVSAFWSLNIFTNQRHLAFGYAVFLFLLLFIYQRNKSISSSKSKYQISNIKSGKLLSFEIWHWDFGIKLGFIVGLFPFIHLTVYMMMCVALLLCFLLFPKIRKCVFIAGIIAGVLGVPQVLLMGSSDRHIEFFHPGYLVQQLSALTFLRYWFYNLGLTLLLFPIGFIFAKKNQRKIGVVFLTFFVIGNLFQFSPEIASNHKFFNLFVIGANMFTAYALYRLWRMGWATKVFVPFIVIGLTFTGIIDLFPIFNDTYIVVDDIHTNKTAQFILKNTSPDSIFLNAKFIDDPASLAGRTIYLGWPYFAWSAGYDTDSRFKQMKNILAATNKQNVCPILLKDGIDYIEIQKPTSIEEAKPNYSFFEQNPKFFFDATTNISIYRVVDICRDTHIRNY